MFWQVLQNSFDLKLINNKQERGVEQELGPSDIFLIFQKYELNPSIPVNGDVVSHVFKAAELWVLLRGAKKPLSSLSSPGLTQ